MSSGSVVWRILAAGLILVFAASVASAAEIAAPKASVRPVIDGVMEDVWQTAAVADLYTTVPGLSGTIRCLWDEEGIYVFAEANGADVVLEEGNPTTPNLGDSTEFAMSAPAASYKQFTYVVDGKTSGHIGKPVDLSRLPLAAMVPTDSGWAIEMFIPANEKNPGGLEMVVGKSYKFELRVRDVLSGVARHLDFPTGGHPNQSATFGTLRFAE